MTALLKSIRQRVRESGTPLEAGVTSGIPTVSRTASRPALDWGGGGQDAAQELVASPRGEVRRVAPAAKAVTS
jgi:hypothetical protein